MDYGHDMLLKWSMVVIFTFILTERGCHPMWTDQPTGAQFAVQHLHSKPKLTIPCLPCGSLLGYYRHWVVKGYFLNEENTVCQTSHGAGNDRFLKWSSSLDYFVLALGNRVCAIRPFLSRFIISTAMISKVKNAMSTLVGGMIPHGHHQHGSGNVQNCGPDGLPPRFPYGRPEFLDLTPELLQYSTDHASRPVLTLKRDSRLAWRTGYAEWVVILNVMTLPIKINI